MGSQGELRYVTYFNDVRNPSLQNPLGEKDGDDLNWEFFKFIGGAGNMSNAVSVTFLQCFKILSEKNKFFVAKNNFSTETILAPNFFD